MLLSVLASTLCRKGSTVKFSKSEALVVLDLKGKELSFLLLLLLLHRFESSCSNALK